ncbi:RNA-directed DNA polymerase, eukaryota, reverse transcriptase zinc-binding domain protein [Tanacetum coccineum]
MDVVGDSLPKGKGRKPRKHRHGIKIRISTPGSASVCVGSTLRNLCSSKLIGKSRKRVDSPIMDHREGKRVISVPIDDEINNVFWNLKSGAINKNLKFAIGSNSMTSNDLKSDVSYDITNGNDGSFIKLYLAKNLLDSTQKGPAAESSSLEPGLVHTSMDVGGNTSCEQTSSRDDITFAETGIVEGRTGSGPSIEHTSMKVVVSTGVGLSSGLDGIACYKDGGNFEFWGNDKESSRNLEEMALKMKYALNAVSKEENGNKRIQLSTEEVYKGGQMCSLQLYGYFVGTFMDYMMVRERCLKKAGRLDFARVLVEVSVNEDLPSVLEITYPPFRVRPRTSEEIAAKDSFIGNREGDSSKNKSNASNMDEDGFVTMKKNNKPVVPSGKYGGGSLGNQPKPFNKASDNLMKKDVKPANQSKSLQQLNKDPNYKHKVLVRGPSFNNSPVSISLEFIPIKNSFQVLVDEDMMDYFYKNFHKFHLDPSYEDDDVESEMDGIASEMKPEYDNDAVIDNGNGSAPSSNVSDEVIDLIREDNFSLCGLLETHVKKNKLASIHRKVFSIWDWVSNNMSCTGGTRIIVSWNPNIINAIVMDQSTSVMHCFVKSINSDLKFHCSFFNAHIHTLDRRSLWKSLQMYSNSIKGAPWIILRDFNATLDPFEKSSSGFKITTTISDFKDCVANIDMDDIIMSGLNFTWNKRPASFVIPEAVKPNTKPFKISNYLTSKDGFMPAFRKVWDCKVDGYFMYFLVSKLRMLKKPLRKLNFDQEAKVKCLKSYRYALKDEESFLKQKSKTTWLKEGDMNSKYFHNVLSPDHAFFMIRDVSDDEVKNALFDIDGNKAPMPDGMIKWIMECVSTTSYSISVNGDIHGFFKGNKGLRQGDLLSPYLFTLEMEFLNLLIEKTYSKTVSVLKKAIDEFSDISGLLPSIPKSTVFFGNVEDFAMARILKVMPLNLGTLPVKYLGVPLISRRVFSKDFQPLIDKKDKVMWKTNSGRYVDFAVSSIWNDIRELLGRLKTQDKMGVWDNKSRLKGLVKLDNAPNCWSDILNFMLKRPFNKSIWSVLQRLLIGASIYFVWLERNLRIFQGKARSVDDIFNLIKEAVRLRVMGLTLNDTVQVFEAAKL